MKFRFKKIFILLAFFVMALTTSGVYASWEYLTGGLTFDNTEIDVNVESFDYPEWTVRFYTGGSLSGQYGGGRKEVASHTFYNKNEEFTFPTNDIGNHPTTTMMYWCTQPIYYFENDIRKIKIPRKLISNKKLFFGNKRRTGFLADNFNYAKLFPFKSR